MGSVIPIKSFSTLVPNKEVKPSELTFSRFKKEICRVTACLVSQTQSSLRVISFTISFSSLLPVTECSHLWWPPLSLRSKYSKEREIPSALLARFSLSVKWELYFSLAQEVLHLGSECWNFFYSAMEMPDGTVVILKRLLCEVTLGIIKLKYLYFTFAQLTASIIKGEFDKVGMQQSYGLFFN